MKLIKCKKCGRPFYDNEPKCPYCGCETSQSAGNYVTQAISDATSHKRMEDVLSGNPQPAPSPVQPMEAPVAELLNAMPQPEAETVIPDVEEALVAETAETVSERAEAMAAIEAAQETAGENMKKEAVEERDEVETPFAPRKRHGWIWIVVIVLLLAAAAAVYWKWDFVYGKVMSLLGK